MVETAPAPLAGPLGVRLGAAVAGLHERNGVAVRCGTAVAGLAGSDRVTGLELADGSVLPTDLVVAGIGADPAVDWLAGSGLDLSSGVVCSAAGATGAPGIWAVGDCSAWYDEHRGRAQRIEHWTDSRDRPAAMVRAMLGGPAGARAGAVLLVRPVRIAHPVRRPSARRRGRRDRGRQRRRR